MENQRQQLSGLWSPYPAYLADKHTVPQVHSVGKHLAEILAVGPFYYYFSRSSDYRISHSSNTILTIHGIGAYPESVQQIIDLIHPDDIDFVIAAEKAASIKVKELDLRNQLNLKISYCFRMRVADGSYHLFHHQAISALHIHTDIQHISPVNNKMITISGIAGHQASYQIDLSNVSTNTALSKLSKREIEVLAYLAQGLSSQQIAEKLYISPTTVRVHRKQLLRKTSTNNTSNLIKKCFDL